MSDSISEAASIKRGRPEVIDNRLLKVAANMSRAKTKRGLQDAWYSLQACGVFLELQQAGETWFEWMVKLHSSSRRDTKTAILAQLGRILADEGEEVMIDVAKSLPVCSAKEGARILRRARGNRSAPGTIDDLVLHLAKALDAYTETRETSAEMAKAALAKLMTIV